MEEDVYRLAAQRAIEYLSALPSRRAVPRSGDVEALVQFDSPLGEEPEPAERIVESLASIGSPATVASSGGRYFGFVIGGTLPAALAADWMVTAWDQSASSDAASPVAAALEAVSLHWLLDIFELPQATAGAFVTGATMANFTALAAARHWALARQGWNVDADGLAGAPPLTAMVSAEAHPSISKSLGLLGLGRGRTVVIQTDEQGRMRPDAIPDVDGAVIICAQVGNVNTGSFDPIEAICSRAAELDAWVHVDGAFGLWAAASPSHRHLLRGIGGAQSWSTDAHKWLNVPYDSGMAFVSDVDALTEAMAMHADYLAVGEGRQPKHYIPELSRRARGVDIWAALRSLGRSGLAALVDTCCRHATRFADGLRDAGYEVLNDVVLNQVLVSFGDADATRRVIAGIQEDGTCWCGGTVWHGRTAMRISVTSWRTSDEDVERSLEAMLRIARHVSTGPVPG